MGTLQPEFRSGFGISRQSGLKTAFHADIVESGSYYASLFKIFFGLHFGCLGNDAGQSECCQRSGASHRGGAGAGDGISESQD
jgi:hypothetical protein